MTNEMNTNHTKLFKSLQLARLQHSLDLVKYDLIKNRPTMTAPGSGFFKTMFDSIGNDFKNTRTNRLSVTQQNIITEKDRFDENCNMLLYNENEIEAAINEIFKNDIYALEKTVFSISIIFDGEYNYEYEKETLQYISAFLWNNENHLSQIKNSIENMYRTLAKQPLSTNQKLLLGGTAALVLLTATVPALALGGMAAPGITSGLAGFGTAFGLGGTMVEGVGLMALAELLLDGAIIGFTYSLLDNHNKNVVKKSFREMNYNNAARMLAIKCYLMHVAKQTMPEEVFKEKINELLEMIQDLKSDTDYVLLVEQENIAENQSKIRVFHNLDDLLARMLC